MDQKTEEGGGVAAGSRTVSPTPPDSTRQFFRLSGFALFLGAVLWGLGETGWALLVGASDPTQYPQPTTTILWLVVMTAFICILLGLPGLHTAQAGKTATFGLIAFLVLFVGEALMVGLANFGAFYQAAVAGLVVDAEEAGMVVEEPVMVMVGFLAAYALHILGWLLFGITALRARVLPRWPMVIAMAVPLLMFISRGLEGVAMPILIPLPLAWAVGVAWLGVALARSEGSPLPRQETAAPS